MSDKFLQIELLKAAHGDCVWLEYGTEHRQWRLLIDGGPIGAYESLQRKIDTLLDGDRTLELVVLTHVDTDHVDGLLRLFAHPREDWKFSTKDVWFNGWRHLDQSVLGGNQGEFFSALIVDRLGEGQWNRAFDHAPVVVPEHGPLPRVKLAGDCTLTLLSPSPEKLQAMRKAWARDIKAFKPGDLDAAWSALASQKKYLPNKTLLGSSAEIDVALARQAKPDSAAANGASIALLLEYAGLSLLLLADAHADVVCASIRRLLSERGLQRLRVDAVKVAHHGSKANINDELLSLIESPHFLISTNGDIFGHPDEEAIQRIIARSWHRPPTLHFNYRTTFNQTWDDATREHDLGYATRYETSESEPLVLRLTAA